MLCELKMTSNQIFQTSTDLKFPTKFRRKPQTKSIETLKNVIFLQSMHCYLSQIYYEKPYFSWNTGAVAKNRRVNWPKRVLSSKSRKTWYGGKRYYCIVFWYIESLFICVLYLLGARCCRSWWNGEWTRCWGNVKGNLVSVLFNVTFENERRRLEYYNLNRRSIPFHSMGFRR